MLHIALKHVREFHRLNQTELAHQLGISRSYLSEIESDRKKPSIDLLNQYSKVFEIAPSSLLLFSEKMESNSLSERTRVKVAGKILKIMDWIAETGPSESEKESKG